ncbi:hypothetical protein [Acinetobacter bohemicus]|uniref:hypothetical protein n=1 Tax=Acinetobacter bohemicus TaxID=1435036 RepID=UPI004042ED20
MKKNEIKQVRQIDALEFNVQIKEKLNQFKVSAITAAITSLICASVPSYAADLEIYKIPEDSLGTATLMLMLDTSGSMDDKDGGTTTRISRLKSGLTDVLQGTTAVPKIKDEIVVGLSTFAGSNGYIRVPARALNTTFTENKIRTVRNKRQRFVKYKNNNDKTRYKYCTSQGSASNNYQCLSWSAEEKKDARDEYDDDNFTYQVCSSNVISILPANNKECIAEYIDYVEVEESYTETTTQRQILIDAVSQLRADGGTPTPYAYAEVAAYLMGTNTKADNYSATYYQTLGNRRTDRTSNYPCRSGDSATNDYRNYKKADGSLITIRWCNDENKSWTPPATASSLIYGRQDGYDRELFYFASDPKSAPVSGTSYSGWSNSQSYDNGTNTITGSTNYVAPSSITSQQDKADKKECSGQGIYFLTDGRPEPSGWPLTTTDGKSGTAYQMMKKSLDTKADLFNCSSSPLGTRSSYSHPNNGWACIGKYAQALLDPEKNPLGLKIRTAVVGFGNSFGGDGVETDDVRDAKDWGTLGGGGWYAGSSPKSISDSINKFIGDLVKDVPSMSTGASTIPMDALNPEIIQPYAYFPQFEPKVNPADSQQLWFGNVKKYYVVNGGVYSSESGGSDYTVVKKSKLQDLTDIWAKSGISYAENSPIFQKGGALSQLKLGTVTENNDKGEPTTTAGRKLLTEYNFDGTQDADKQVSRDFDLKQINYTYTTDANTKTDAASRVRGLMALLGYNINTDTDTNNFDLSTVTANLRQMGSVYHSLPVLLTQEGQAVAERNTTTNKIQISTTGRKDYVMFGTTQGLLSVVDASDGVEKFSFVPKEMIERQSETFKANAGNLAGGKEALYYGLDGEWAAHTVYVTKPDGTLTVTGAVRNAVGSATDKENLNGKQWVYGGMRMGGRSYYALDLTNIDSPKLKFHIDPTTGKVYSEANPNGKTFAPIENMAQSWSKPKLDYVNWQGQRKLVMFVGGGYDAGGDNGDGLYANGIRTGYAGYEHYNYQQDNKKGAGVYMFDADTGDLLWYADSTQPATPTDPTEGDGAVTDETIAHVVNGDLQYSVASDIKTIDRDNDGVVDHLYFGDLAGQAFRVDFQNDGKADGFDSQVTKILNLHQEDGTSPRFYMAPVFTAHHSAHKKEGADVVVASFISGNKSAPLLATIDSPTSTGKKDPLGLQYDAVYAVYDYDIHPNGQFYPQSHVTARTLADTTETTASTGKLKYISNIVRDDSEETLVKGAVANSSTGWGGWYYRFDKKFDASEAKESIVKGISPLIAMEGSLYVTMYDASNNGTSSSCGAGVKGHSFTQRICLPTGVCPENANYKYNLGAGIVNLNVGSVDGSNKKSIVVPDPEDIGKACVGTACKDGQKFITAGGSIRFIPNRWYERYAKAD